MEFLFNAVSHKCLCPLGLGSELFMYIINLSQFQPHVPFFGGEVGVPTSQNSQSQKSKLILLSKPVPSFLIPVWMNSTSILPTSQSGNSGVTPMLPSLHSLLLFNH